MKRIRFISILFLTGFVVGCSNNEPVILKQETNDTDPSSNPELVQEKNEDDETSAFIEFFLPEEQVTINLKMIPILNQYLHAVPDRNQAVKKMNLIPVHADYDTLYLLEFSCHDDTCSYILIDQSKDNQSHLIADLSNYIQMEFSPNMEKLFFQFNRPTDFSMSLGHIVVVDLNDWELLNPTTNDATALNYHRPFLEVSWENDDSISLVVPPFVELTEKNMTTWHEADYSTETVILNIAE